MNPGRLDGRTLKFPVLAHSKVKIRLIQVSIASGFPHCKQSANQMESLCTGERGDRLASVDILALVYSLVPRSSEGVYESWLNLDVFLPFR